MPTSNDRPLDIWRNSNPSTEPLRKYHRIIFNDFNDEEREALNIQIAVLRSEIKNLGTGSAIELLFAMAKFMSENGILTIEDD